MHQSTDASSNKEDAGSSDTARTLNEDLVEKQEKLESTVEELTVIASGAYDVLEVVDTFELPELSNLVAPI